VLRVRLMEGRTFREDDDPKGQPVAIVNETLAHRYWPNGEAVGQRIRFGTRANTEQVDHHCGRHGGREDAWV